MSSKNAAELVEDLNSRVETVCTVLLLCALSGVVVF